LAFQSGALHLQLLDVGFGLLRTLQHVVKPFASASFVLCGDELRAVRE
jgi:hypothetical protein